MIERLSTDVAVIGGGIVGASAALALRRMGIGVALLDKGWCGAQASGVNYGGVRRQGRPVEQLPLAMRAHAIWRRLADEIGIDGEYIRSGHLKLARTESDLTALQAYRERSAGFGMDLEILSGNAFRDRFPWLGRTAIAGSLCPEDGHANPRLVSPAFARAAGRLGAEVRENSPVDEVARAGDGFVIRSGERLEVRAKFLVNSAGAWAGPFAAQFGEPVPLYAVHPNMMVTEPLPVFMDVNIGIEGGGIYARQVARGNCVIGGGRGVALDADLARPSGGATAELMARAADLFPALRHAQVIRTWTGVEGEMPGARPVIGPSATTPGLLHAFGFSGAGFQIGPAVGEVLAELVRDGRTTTPIEAFAIDRHALPNQESNQGDRE